MAEFDVPLSLIYDLAISQSAQYYLDSRYMAGFEDPMVKERHSDYNPDVYLNEMEYWDLINRTLCKIRENLEE